MAKKAKRELSGGTEIRGVDLVEVERLLSFMDKHGLEEFEYEAAGVRIRLKKPSAFPIGAHRPVPMVEASAVAPAHPVQAAAPQAPHPAASRAAEHAPASDLHLIKSPIVGTFYNAPSPGADAFVSRGTRVEPGQVLCIIEAMKLMNEIESDIGGEVAEIYVENGKPVEYGQPLFGIRAHGKK